MQQFKNLSQPEEIITKAFNLKNTSNWKIQDARKSIAKLEHWESYINGILYRPFDKRYIFYHQSVIERMRAEIMSHMLEENIGLTVSRQVKASMNWRHCLISNTIIESTYISNKTSEISYIFPLWRYSDIEKQDFFNQHQTDREPNIQQSIFDQLSSVYNNKPTPEEILYYIYGIFYSNIYRDTFTEFLKIDFPRVPFTADKKLFMKLSKLGNELAELHLLKNPALDIPIAKYQGMGTNDRVGKVTYIEKEHRVYINKDKYFEGIRPEVWNYHIGGYQVLNKYLKDRKSRLMDDPPHYCRIVTALSKTIEIQKKIDEIYPAVEENVIEMK